MEETQINIRCSIAVAERLKAITKAERIKSGELLERLLDCYQDSIKILSTDTGLAETVKALETRLLALESRFDALRSVETVRQGRWEKEADSAALVASDVAPDDAGAETVVVEQGAVNYDTEAWKKAVIEYYKDGVRKPDVIAKMAYAAGYQTTNKTMRDGSFVKKVLVKAKLVEG